MKYNPEFHHRRSVRLKGYDYAKEGIYFVTICTKDRIHFFGEVENREMVMSPFGEIAHREWEKLPDRWPHIELGTFQVMPNHMHGILVIHRPLSAVVQATTDPATTDWATTRVAPTPNHGNDQINHGDTNVGATLVVAQSVFAQSVFAQSEAARSVVTPNPFDPPEPPFSKIQWSTRPYLGQIIGAYKSIVSTECLKYHQKHQPDAWLDKIWQRSFDERIVSNAVAFENISNYILNNPKNWKDDKFFD